MTKPAQKDEYTERSWCGMIVYDCIYCAFDTMDEDTIKKHIIAAHSMDPDAAADFPASKPESSVRGVKLVKEKEDVEPDGEEKDDSPKKKSGKKKKSK